MKESLIRLLKLPWIFLVYSIRYIWKFVEDSHHFLWDYKDSETRRVKLICTVGVTIVLWFFSAPVWYLFPTIHERRQVLAYDMNRVMYNLPMKEKQFESNREGQLYTKFYLEFNNITGEDIDRLTQSLFKQGWIFQSKENIDENRIIYRYELEKNLYYSDFYTKVMWDYKTQYCMIIFGEDNHLVDVCGKYDIKGLYNLLKIKTW